VVSAAVAESVSPAESISNTCSDIVKDMIEVHQAYRYALDPTPRQARALASHCGAARFAYNWGLSLVKERLSQRATGLIRCGSALDAAGIAPGVEPHQG
jgi:hypothetical protein